MAKELKPGEVLLRAEDFPADIGDGLESDLVVEEGTLDPDRLWCVAIAKKSRLKKAVSEQFRLKLEELTGREWRTDEISKFVFHLVTVKSVKSVAKKIKKGRCKVGKKSKKKQTTKDTKGQEKKERPTSNAQRSTSNMEVVFNREALLEALKLASLAAAKSSPKYILEHVLIRAAMDIVNIRATDLEVGLDIQVVQSETKVEGYAVLPAAEFTEAVARCEDETITLRRTEKCVQLITSNGRYEFNLVDVNEFPTIQPGPDEFKGCELKLADLQAAVGKVLHAVSKEATRYALNGVLWEGVAGGLNLAATDGHRLAKVCLKTGSSGNMTSNVISKKTAELLAHLTGDDDTVVRVEISESNIFAATDGVYMCGLLLTSEFPNYGGIIPKSCGHSISLDAAAVAKQVRRAKILESEDKNVRNITISSENGELLFDNRNPKVGSAEMRLAIAEDAKSGAGDFEISVRGKYLLDALKTMERFRLEVNDSDQPLVLADETTIHVIMPVKV